MLVDAHVNITHDGEWFNTDHDASLARLLREMEAAHIDKCLLIAMPHATNNKYISSVVAEHPKSFKGIGAIDFTKEPCRQVKEVLDLGLSGIKLHPRLQGVDLLDERFRDFFLYLEERRVPIMIDGYFQTDHRQLSLNSLTPFYYDSLAKAYRDIPMILSHMGGHRVLDAFFMAKSNPNVYLDNSHLLKYFIGTSVIDDALWVMDKLDEKIIYGSDFPEYSLPQYLDHFETITAKNPAIRKDLIYANVCKIFDF